MLRTFRLRTRWLLLVCLVLAPRAVADKIIHTTDWVASDEMAVILQRMNLNNLFPCHIEGRRRELNLEYRADYCYFKPGMRWFYSRWGLTEEQYQGYTQFYRENRYAEYSRSTFSDAGNTLYQVTWIQWTNKQAETSAVR
ncbi:MAG: hypothetical protein KDI09_08810 [Halioglobus sp.]|nr:hypothetical protein [Halioglobus sp.]